MTMESETCELTADELDAVSGGSYKVYDVLGIRVVEYEKSFWICTSEQCTEYQK